MLLHRATKSSRKRTSPISVTSAERTRAGGERPPDHGRRTALDANDRGHHAFPSAGTVATCDPSEGICGPRPRPHRAPVLVTPWLSQARPDADRARRVWSPERDRPRRPRRGHDRVGRQALDQARARDVAGRQPRDRDLAGAREGLPGRARPRRRHDRRVGQHGAVGVGRTFVGLGLFGRWHPGVPAEMPGA